MTGNGMALCSAHVLTGIGDLCQIGSTIQILAADHPRDPALRRQGFEGGIPVRIGESVWIGNGAMILP